MTRRKKRLVVRIAGPALVLTLGACAADEGPPVDPYPQPPEVTATIPEIQRTPGLREAWWRHCTDIAALDVSISRPPRLGEARIVAEKDKCRRIFES